MYKSVYNITCACNLMRNGNIVPFNFKGKGKRLHIYAYFDDPNSQTMNYTKHPYLQLEPSNTNDPLYKCGLYQISKIHQPFLQEGKITIDVIEGEESLNLKVSDISLKSQLTQKQYAHLCISESTSQSLKLFITKITSLIQQYAEKSKTSLSNKTQTNSTSSKQTEQPNNKQQINSKQLLDPKQQIDQKQKLDPKKQVDPKAHFQFKAEKRVSVNQMKINVQPSKRQSSVEQPKDLVINEVVEIDKQPKETNLTKYFNKIENQNTLISKPKQVNQQLIKSPQSGNSDEDKKKIKKRGDSIEKSDRKDSKDPIKNNQMEDDFESQQQLKQTQLLQSTENKMIAEQPNDNKEFALISSSNETTSNLSTSKNSPQINSSPQIEKNKQSTNQNQNSYIIESEEEDEEEIKIYKRASAKNNSNSNQSLIDQKQLQQSKNPNQTLPRKMNEKSEIDEDINLILEIEQDEESQLECNQEDKLQIEQRKLQFLNQQQQLLCEKQILLNQQDKLLKKQQMLTIQQMLVEQEDSLNQEEFNLILQKQKLQKEYNNFANLNAESSEISQSNKITMQKYFLEKKDIESQYEKEQRQVQKEIEKNQENNNSKFVSFQSKLQEIKSKQQQKNIELNQISNKKSLYKVDRQNLPLQNGQQQTFALKRRNPFTYNEDENENNNDLHEKVSQNLTNQKNNSEEMRNESQESSNKNNEMNDDLYDNIQDDTKLQQNLRNVQNGNRRTMAYQLRDGVTPADLPEQIQSVKKVGGRFVFEKNSFNIKKIDSQEERDQNNTIQNRTQQKEKRILKLSQDSTNNSQQDNTKNEISNIEQLLLKLPNFVIHNIFQFISKKQLMQIRITSKFFNEAVFISIKSLSFTKRDTPIERVVQMMNKAKFIQALTFGNLVNVKPDMLIEKVHLKENCINLRKLDLSKYVIVNSRLILLLLKSCKQLTDFYLPYFSRITDDILVQLSSNLNQLNRFGLKSKLDNFHNNDKISDTTLAKVITDNPKLHTFEVFNISPNFFDKINSFENNKKSQYDEKLKINTKLETLHLLKPYDNVYERMKCLKIRNLVMTRFAEDEIASKENNLLNISNFANLQTLKIVNIVKKSKGEWFLPHTPKLSTIDSIFSKCINIKELSLGQWCTNEVLSNISQHISNLIKIRLMGNQVDDNGFEYILQKMEQLEEINIVDATRINGHCMENIISRQIKIIHVRFDDYRINCLNTTITHHLQLEGVKIINVTQ